MFTTRTYYKRDFAPKYQSVIFPASEFNIQSTAFLGVVSKGEKMFHFLTCKRAINAEHFMDFLEGLKRKHGKKRMFIYMDNLRVHMTKAVRATYEKLNMTPIFAPPYSPDLNPIEFVFSIMKQSVKKMRLQDMLKRR